MNHHSEVILHGARRYLAARVELRDALKRIGLAHPSLDDLRYAARARAGELLDALVCDFLGIASMETAGRWLATNPPKAHSHGLGYETGGSDEIRQLQARVTELERKVGDLDGKTDPRLMGGGEGPGVRY
jgi:hypothetical protein